MQKKNSISRTNVKETKRILILKTRIPVKVLNAKIHLLLRKYENKRWKEIFICLSDEGQSWMTIDVGIEIAHLGNDVYGMWRIKNDGYDDYAVAMVDDTQ